MRGAVSLAAALALPLTIDGGAPFPDRDLIIFLAFSVILATLLLQGLTLPPLIKLLGVDDADEQLEREEVEARLRAAEAALRGSTSWRTRTGCATTPSIGSAARTATASGGSRPALPKAISTAGSSGDGIDYETRSEAYQRLVRELLEAQRDELIEMRDRGEINDDVLRRLERELDLEDSRLEI